MQTIWTHNRESFNFFVSPCSDWQLFPPACQLGLRLCSNAFISKKGQVAVFLVYSHHIFAVSSVNYCRKRAASLLQVNEVWQWHVKISLQTFWQCRAVLRMLDFPGLIQYNISKLNLSWAFYYGNKSKCKCHTKFCFFSIRPFVL